MKTVAILRQTYDPKQVAELGLEGGVVQRGRVGLSLNEGDIKGIELLSAAKLDMEVISVGALDDTSRVHTFVRGAQEIYELDEKRSHQYDEHVLAKLLAAQIKKMGDVNLIVCSNVEQDTGRGLLPSLLAGYLGVKYFSNAAALKMSDDGVSFDQISDAGTQGYLVKGAVVLSPDESCSLGEDPSDQYDLIEKLEAKASQKLDVSSLGVSVDDDLLKMKDYQLPAAKQAQSVENLSKDTITKIVDVLQKQMSV